MSQSICSNFLAVMHDQVKSNVILFAYRAWNFWVEYLLHSWKHNNEICNTSLAVDNRPPCSCRIISLTNPFWFCYSLHGKSQPITASFTDSKGDLQKLFLFGELSPDDSLVVKSVLARHIQILKEEEVTYTPLPTTGSFDAGEISCMHSLYNTHA